MEWDMDGGSDIGSEGSFGGGSAVSDADAAALGMDAQPPEFYDPEADERDEAWVHKARGALRSDAILSCPLCFTTLCIDCQQHAKYDGQFRAMFVMNCRVKTNERVTLPSPPLSRKQQKKQERQQRRQQQQDAAQASAGEQAAAGDEDGEQQQQQQQQQQLPQAQPPRAAGAAAAPAAGGQPGGGGGGEGPLHPVCCAVCDTEVGLRDAAEGVYHLFNVFASNS